MSDQPNDQLGLFTEDLKAGVPVDVPSTALAGLREFATRGAAAREAAADVLRGLSKRDRGVARAWDATHQEWKDLAFAMLQILASAGEEFTAEDLRELAGDPPGHPNAMGALFNLAAKRGLIRKLGFRKATRPSLHATELAVWVGVRRMGLAG